jgi:hypothetical protein
MNVSSNVNVNNAFIIIIIIIKNVKNKFNYTLDKTAKLLGLKSSKNEIDHIISYSLKYNYDYIIDNKITIEYAKNNIFKNLLIIFEEIINILQINNNISQAELSRQLSMNKNYDDNNWITYVLVELLNDITIFGCSQIIEINSTKKKKIIKLLENASLELLHNYQSENVQSEDIQTNNVQFEDIQTNYVQTNDIQTNYVQTNDIQTNNIQSEDIQTNNIQSEDIQTNNVQSEDIQTNNVQSEDIQTNYVQSEDIQTNYVQSEDIQSEDIQTNNVQSEDIQTNYVQSEDIQSEDIQTNNIQSEDIQPNNVQSEDIQTNNVQSEDIQTNSVQSEDIQTNYVQSEVIQTNNVQSEDIKLNIHSDFIDKRIKDFEKKNKFNTYIVNTKHDDFINSFSNCVFTNLIKDIFTNSYLKKHNCSDCGNPSTDRCHGIGDERPKLIRMALEKVYYDISKPTLLRTIAIAFLREHKYTNFTFKCNNCHKKERNIN